MNSWSWYISHFPESMFLCDQQYQQDYATNIIRGKENAAKSKILICGITRNSQNILPYTLARIRRLGSYFESYVVFLYENDSVDNTVDILKQEQEKYTNFFFTSEYLNSPPFTDPKGVVRMRNMAMARNHYLDFVRQYIKTEHIDYIIIVDCDLLGGWSYHGILNSLGNIGNWDIVGSNSLYYLHKDKEWFKVFYDTFAFRSLGIEKEIDGTEGNMFVFNRGEPMIQVNSCFGGLGIYKPHFLHEGLNYTEEDCEHVTLHNKLVKLGYQIFLNPSQITLYNKSQYVI
jgi:hypothetical protein